MLKGSTIPDPTHIDNDDDLEYEEETTHMPWPAITWENNVKRNNLKLRYNITT